MNLSGRSVEQAYRKVGGGKWGRLCVVHDDLEVALGDFRVRQRGKGKYVTFLLCDVSMLYCVSCGYYLAMVSLVSVVYGELMVEDIMA
jgi:hypothetical protein